MPQLDPLVPPEVLEAEALLAVDAEELELDEPEELATVDPLPTVPESEPEVPPVLEDSEGPLAVEPVEAVVDADWLDAAGPELPFAVEPVADELVEVDREPPTEPADELLVDELAAEVDPVELAGALVDELAAEVELVVPAEPAEALVDAPVAIDADPVDPLALLVPTVPLADPEAEKDVADEAAEGDPADEEPAAESAAVEPAVVDRAPALPAADDAEPTAEVIVEELTPDFVPAEDAAVEPPPLPDDPCEALARAVAADVDDRLVAAVEPVELRTEPRLEDEKVLPEGPPADARELAPTFAAVVADPTDEDPVELAVVEEPVETEEPPVDPVAEETAVEPEAPAAVEPLAVAESAVALDEDEAAEPEPADAAPVVALLEEVVDPLVECRPEDELDPELRAPVVGALLQPRTTATPSATNQRDLTFAPYSMRRSYHRGSMEPMRRQRPHAVGRMNPQPQGLSIDPAHHSGELSPSSPAAPERGRGSS